MLRGNAASVQVPDRTSWLCWGEMIVTQCWGPNMISWCWCQNIIIFFLVIMVRRLLRFKYDQSVTLHSQERPSAPLQDGKSRGPSESSWERTIDHRVLPQLLCHDWKGGGQHLFDSMCDCMVGECFVWGRPHICPFFSTQIFLHANLEQKRH